MLYFLLSLCPGVPVSSTSISSMCDKVAVATFPAYIFHVVTNRPIKPRPLTGDLGMYEVLLQISWYQSVSAQLPQTDNSSYAASTSSLCARHPKTWMSRKTMLVTFPISSFVCFKSTYSWNLVLQLLLPLPSRRPRF